MEDNTMTLLEIYYAEDLSNRSFNVCKNNDLNDLTDILNYYNKNNTFLNLKNCGKQSNEQLIAICLKHNKVNNIIENAKPENEINYTVANFNRIRREIINSFIETNSQNLSIRAGNALNSCLDGDLKFKNINERIISNSSFKFEDVRNVGVTTIKELQKFIDSIVAFIEKVLKIDNDNDLVALRNKFFIEQSFSISNIPNEILESQSIFKLVNFLINEDALFEKNESNIFLKSFKIYNNQTELTVHGIAEEIQMSRERVRQVRKKIIKNLHTTLQFVKNIDDDLYQKYNIDQNQDFIKIDKDLNEQINEVNKTNFSIEFNTFLIFTYFSERFNLVGEIGDVLLPKYSNSSERYNWQNFYLVNKQLTGVFNFNNFTYDVDRRANERVEITYSFNFKSYLYNFIETEDNSIIKRIIPIAERILNQEFDLTIDLDDNLVFKKNTLKQVSEYAIEALEKLGLPSKLEDIYKIIEENDPEITKSQEALRGSLQRTPEIIYFGRSSTYGLKKWEIEKEGIKGGTIKDIIFEYLKGKTDPIHVLELLHEVHNYREKTNTRNIITNLKLDPQKQFIIFNQSFVGLNGKTYNSNLTSLPKFLGKSITNYIDRQKFATKTNVANHFSMLLNISEQNMIYIIDHLIEQEFVYIDNQNNLSL